MSEFKTYKEVQKEGYSKNKIYIFLDDIGDPLIAIKGEKINEILQITQNKFKNVAQLVERRSPKP